MKCEICNCELKSKSALIAHKKSCIFLYENKDNIKKSYLEYGYSITKLSKEYNISKDTLLLNLEKWGIKRNASDAAKLAHKLYPESFKHTTESKQKMREKRLNFMKKNPEQTAWRKSNLSYPEKLFKDEIEKRGLDKIYLIQRELPVHPFFIDFAFVTKKVAVEIDGSQHLEEDRKERDKRKEELLISNGWKVLRFTENEVKKNIYNCLDIVENICEERENYQDITKVGIFTSKEVNFCNCGKEITYVSKNCIKCSGKLSSLPQRKVERPPYKQLIDEINELGYSATGRKYGVSDNSIRKWVRFYENVKI
jgi:very-short-patch-repair endonuclease